MSIALFDIFGQYLSPQTAVAITGVSTIIGLISMMIAKSSAAIGKKEYNSHFKPVWNVSIISNNLKFENLDQNQVPSQIVVLLPSRALVRHQIVELSKRIFFTKRAALSIEALLKKSMTLEPGTGVISQKFLPVYILTTFVAKGVVKSDCSLYFLKFNCYAKHNKDERWKVEFTGLAFNKRMFTKPNIIGPNERMAKRIDNLFDELLATNRVFPPRLHSTFQEDPYEGQLPTSDMIEKKIK